MCLLTLFTYGPTALSFFSLSDSCRLRLWALSFCLCLSVRLKQTVFSWTKMIEVVRKSKLFQQWNECIVCLSVCACVSESACVSVCYLFCLCHPQSNPLCQEASDIVTGNCHAVTEKLFNCSNMYDANNNYHTSYTTCVDDSVDPMKVWTHVLLYLCWWQWYLMKEWTQILLYLCWWQR